MKYLLFLLGSSAALAQTANQCADLKRFQMPGAAIEVTRAEMSSLRAGSRRTRWPGADFACALPGRRNRR